MMVMVMVMAMAVVAMVAVMAVMVVMVVIMVIVVIMVMVCVCGTHHRPHLVKHRSDPLKHRANVQDVLKAPHRSTMQEGPSLDS